MYPISAKFNKMFEVTEPEKSRENTDSLKMS